MHFGGGEWQKSGLFLYNSTFFKDDKEKGQYAKKRLRLPDSVLGFVCQSLLCLLCGSLTQGPKLNRIQLGHK